MRSYGLIFGFLLGAMLGILLVFHIHRVRHEKKKMTTRRNQMMEMSRMNADQFQASDIAWREEYNPDGYKFYISSMGETSWSLPPGAHLTQPSYPWNE